MTIWPLYVTCRKAEEEEEEEGDGPAAAAAAAARPLVGTVVIDSVQMDERIETCESAQRLASGTPLPSVPTADPLHHSTELPSCMSKQATELQSCAQCNKPIANDDDSFRWKNNCSTHTHLVAHAQCFLRTVDRPVCPCLTSKRVRRYPINHGDSQQLKPEWKDL